jgi:hypothetical protein
MALAPSRALLSVPSSVEQDRSTVRWSRRRARIERLGDLAVDVVDGVSTPLPR